ncbi:MAG: hypothetical protein MK193_01555 [Lentisphaeria bacterium]|nr:hypothetical protein [Lentisphaeria bacterium]
MAAHKFTRRFALSAELNWSQILKVGSGDADFGDQVPIQELIVFDDIVYFNVGSKYA